jgi:hypothetical protein
MTIATQPLNRTNATFTSRMPARLSSTSSAPARQEPSRSFMAVLLRCLSACNA